MKGVRGMTRRPALMLLACGFAFSALAQTIEGHRELPAPSIED
jgi:hypothetical protein